MYKNSIGIIVPDLSNSQLAFYISHGLNQLSYNTANLDCTVFTENTAPQIIPNIFSVMELTQIWNFHGVLISTTLSNTEMMIKATTSARKLFYIWDMEWLRGEKNFKQNISILRNPQISLLTRSEDYANLTENYCGIKPTVIERFNFGEIIKWISNTY